MAKILAKETNTPFISGGKNFHWVSQPPTGRSGGLLSGINLDMFQVESEMLGRYTVVMEITRKEDGNKWSLINVYGAAQAEDKDNFLIELAGCFHSAKYSIIAGGDYNIMRYSSEKSKGHFDRTYPDKFNAVINCFELRDRTHGQKIYLGKQWR